MPKDATKRLSTTKQSKQGIMKSARLIYMMLFSAFVGFSMKSSFGIQSLIGYSDEGQYRTWLPDANADPSSAFQAIEGVVRDPVFWIADKEDDYYERVYVNTSKLTHLRQNLSVKHFFSPVCGRYRFHTSFLPNVSVVMTMRNEQEGMATLTTHAILARTPPELLVEIIIVNDSDDKDTEEMQALERVSEKIVHVHTTDREGCARSRLIGARMAKGEVLMFIDSHIEMLSSTWYQHLVLPIVENPHTIASQTLEYMGDLKNHTYNDPSSRGSHYGSVTENFFFGYESIRFKGTAYTSTPSRTEPFEMPFAPGAMFAIRKDEFWRLGGYDKGLYVWGAENLELSIKIWVCGGRLIQVPCSSSGHMYRDHDMHKWSNDNFTTLNEKLNLTAPGEYKAYGGHTQGAMGKIWLRNNIRIAKLWLGDWKRYYYKKVFGSEELPPDWARFEAKDEHMKEQLHIKAKNQCRDFTWFDRHVYSRIIGIHNPWWNDYLRDRNESKVDNDDDVVVELPPLKRRQHGSV